MSSPASIHPKVFISYSHDSREHADRVLALSDRLRAEGIDCWIDQYEFSPPEGWPQWMRNRIQWADFVLVVCTETYHRRFEGQEEEGKGLGVKWEGAVITQTLYNDEGKNSKFIPVLFSPSDRAHRPSALVGATFYDISTPEGYAQLYRHLTRQPKAIPRPLGAITAMPPIETMQDFFAGAPPPPPSAQTAPPPRKDVEPERTNPQDDAVMIYIPEGEFLMGSTGQEVSALVSQYPSIKDFFEAEKPQHRVSLDGYWIYKYPVTVAQYRKFCEATKRQMPSLPKWSQDDHPIVNVSWNDAVEYCEWASETSFRLRLPTEAEWEKAARGTDGRKYPWGNEWDTNKCNNYETGPKRTTAVGSYSQGVSPFGVHDMAGNVWEWCSSLYKPYKYDPNDGREDVQANGSRVLRGGSWAGHDDSARCALRDYNAPASDGDDIGFRCARTP